MKVPSPKVPTVTVYPIIQTYGIDIAQEILDTDCRALRAAMKGLGTDEASIINILISRPNAYRYMLKHRYKALLGRDLIQDLKSELSCHFEDVCIAMLESPFELDCRSLYEAMAHLGIRKIKGYIQTVLADGILMNLSLLKYLLVDLLLKLRL